MGRRTKDFPPMAYDGSGKRRVQWGPRLTSGSGSPSWTAPQAPRCSCVLLPEGQVTPLAVSVSGVPQTVGEDYVVLGRTILFTRELVREHALRRLIGVLRRAGSRRHERVDVWLGSEDGVSVARDLPTAPHR